MTDSNQKQLLEEVLSIIGRGEAPWQQSIGGGDRLSAGIEPADASVILEQIDKALDGRGLEQEQNVGILHALELSGWTKSDGTAIAAKSFDMVNKKNVALAFISDGDDFNRILRFEYMSEGRNVAASDMALIPVGATEGQALELAAHAIENAEESIQASYGFRIQSEIEKKTEFDQLVPGQNLVIEKAVDDGMSYVGTVAGEDGGTVIVKVGEHRAVAMSKARMEGDVEVGENSRFGYENQYGNDERGRAIRDKNIELGGQRYAVIDMDDLVQQNRRSIMGKVLAVEPDAVYTKFGKDADGRDQVVAHNPAKLDVIPVLGSFAFINYAPNGLGKLATKDRGHGLDQQIER